MIYLVSTPIGNLADITTRAIDILRSVDRVLSEDTRKTGLLLGHFGIRKPQMSFHEHNEKARLDQIAVLVERGESLALVTDSGTPGISDPGFRLVRRAIDAGWGFSAIPGPAAFLMALILSGLPVHSFTFRGFPPRKHGPRKRFLESDKISPYTLIYYESPHRLKLTLADMLDVFGDRPAAVANDLTKFYETVHRGTLSKLIASQGASHPKGEYTVVVHGMSGDAMKVSENPDAEPE